jgi:DNA-binding PadR family transcriptional regulator
MDQRPESFLPLKTDTLLILLALAPASRHGYGIIRDVEERTDGETRLQTGALYRTLRRLLSDGLIQEGERPPKDRNADERRQYYGLTRLGRAVMEAETARMARLVRAVRLTHAGRKPRLL